MGQLFSKSSETTAQKPSSDFDKFFEMINNESRILSQKYITLIRSHLERGDIPRGVSAIRDALKEIESAPINVAVTGESGTGKSSFINALRGVGQEEGDAAPTGVVETTMKRAPYRHPKIPSVTIWDLPGIGTTTFTTQKYLEEVKFDTYDFFIIISCTRFKENDAQLAKLIHKMKKNFYFVRTRMDTDLHSLQMSKPKTFNKDSVLQAIRNDCLKHLKKSGVADPRVFLVSNLHVSDYDFPNLENTILKELPAHKRHNFMLSLPSVTEDIIEGKRSVLIQKIWLESFLGDSFNAASFPESINDNDEKMLVDTLNRMRTFFKLNDASLEKMAKNLNVSLEELKGGIESANFLTCQKANYQTLANILKCFPVNEHFPVPVIHKTKRIIIQVYILDLVVKDAKALLKNEIFGIDYLHT